ncbi:TPA: hypothetical protein ACH3X1_011688 [Trebouxia sp. C0004]
MASLASAEEAIGNPPSPLSCIAAAPCKGRNESEEEEVDEKVASPARQNPSKSRATRATSKAEEQGHMAAPNDAAMRRGRNRELAAEIVYTAINGPFKPVATAKAHATKHQPLRQMVDTNNVSKASRPNRSAEED